MRSNVQYSEESNSIQEIDKAIAGIEKLLKDIITRSIEEIKKDPIKEKELISLWANHTTNISNFFFEECERTNNKELYKSIVKYIIFKK